MRTSSPAARRFTLGLPGLLASLTALVVLAVAAAGFLLHLDARAESLEREAALWRESLEILYPGDRRPALFAQRPRRTPTLRIVLAPSAVAPDDTMLKKGLAALRAKPPSPEALEAADDLERKSLEPADLATRLADLLGDERILGDHAKWESAKAGAPGLVWHVRLSRVGMSRDRRTALFYIDRASGPLAGAGWLSLYRWVGKRWKPIATVWSWIS